MLRQWYNIKMKKHDGIQARFVCSAAHYDQLPAPQGDEFCLMGRSNVGKSSFINHVLEARGLAHVSKRPGKTTCANVYQISDGTAWIDLPGYGFALAPKDEKIRWNRLIEEYCEKRQSLMGCIWLLDVRHVGLAADIIAYRWFAARGMPLFPVLTKCDKVSKNELSKRVCAFAEAFGISTKPVCYSTMQSMCREEFWGQFRQWQNALK
jgi:GTP-binding protein